MGQSSSNQHTHRSDYKFKNKTEQDITFYTTVSDQIFGNVQIYAANKKPLCYLAKIQHTQPNSSFFQIFSKIQNCQSKFLVNLFAFQIKRNQVLGFIQEKVVAYWQYYNFYLADYLKARQIKKIPLNQGEIWHIIQGCVNCCQIFQYFGLHYDLDITNIIVTPQGKIKFYWHHLRQDNSHLGYYKKIKQSYQNSRQGERIFTKNSLVFQKSDNIGHYLSPQEIFLINNKQTFNNDRQNYRGLDLKGCNSYRLGMIIIFCVTLNNPALTCYNFNQSKIHKSVLFSIIQNKFIDSGYYSRQLVNLLQLLLEEKAQKRIKMDEIKSIYSIQMEKNYQLLVSGKQSQNKQGTISSDIQSNKFVSQERKNNNFIKKSVLSLEHDFKQKTQSKSSQVEKDDDIEQRRTIKIKYNSSSTSNAKNESKK